MSIIRVSGEDVSGRARNYPARPTRAVWSKCAGGRVGGLRDRRTFDIGSDVRAGQILCVPRHQAVKGGGRGPSIDAWARATADIAQAEANLLKARQDVARLEPLVKEEAAAKQDLDNALAARHASDAVLDARKATLEANRAILRTAIFGHQSATIRAPIGGRVGDSVMQVGGLVTKASALPLTTIVPLDPVWVRFQISEAELPVFQHAHSQPLPIELVLGDGTVHPHQGRIGNTLNSVNTKTGTMEVQAMFRNPDHAVLPGQFARVRVRMAERTQALVVPQRAVQELQGQQSVLTLGPDNTVQVRGVVTGDRVDQRWIIEQGLTPGESVIVDGLQKARSGAPVTPRLDVASSRRRTDSGDQWPNSSSTGPSSRSYPA